jgi:MFS family permease
MGVLDVFIVNVATAHMQRELNGSFADIQLVVAGYTLAYSVGLVTGGRLGDAFGRRRIFLIGTVLFGLTSAGCAAAPTISVLMVLRVVQGLSAALMLPQVLAIIQVTFPANKRTKAIGFYGATIGVGAIAGLVIGGALLAWNPAGLGWRSVFLVNVPLCLICVIGTVRTIKELPAGRRVSLDLIGVLLLAAAMFSLLHPIIILGDGSGWTATDTMEIIAALALFALFRWWEHALAKRGGTALLPPALFRQAGFTKGLGTALCFYSGNAALVLLLSYYMQRGLGATPLQSALAFTPAAAATAVTSLCLIALRARFGNRVFALGGATSVAGLLLILLVVTLHRPSPLAQALLMMQPGLLLYGLGGGVIAPSIVSLSLAETAPHNAGAASGGLLTATQAANAAGVAVIGSIFSAAYATSHSYPHAFATSLLGLSVLFLATTVLLHTFHPTNPTN